MIVRFNVYGYNFWERLITFSPITACLINASGWLSIYMWVVLVWFIMLFEWIFFIINIVARGYNH